MQQTTRFIEELETPPNLGQKAADKIAKVGGSWKFIICFFLFLTIWIFINTVFLKNRAFDPYPFILLNLFLSCIAAIQAPIIMMSQNRTEEKDRLRARNDYEVNLKAELEIEELHEKLDKVRIEQFKEIIRLQDKQIKYLEDIISKLK